MTTEKLHRQKGVVGTFTGGGLAGRKPNTPKLCLSLSLITWPRLETPEIVTSFHKFFETPEIAQLKISYFVQNFRVKLRKRSADFSLCDSSASSLAIPAATGRETPQDSAQDAVYPQTQVFKMC